ncbi:MAG: hypothetical protein J1E04_01370 [Alistipes sp.]|nr:hypothetical protein [Alistipes sp.]
MKKYLLLATICIVTFCGCKKEEPIPMPQFERTFVWNIYVSPKEFSDKVAASADSTQVSKVIMESDGEHIGGGVDVSEIIEVLIDPVTEACGKNKYKLHHTGIIKSPRIRKTTPEVYAAQQFDSAKLANMGYAIVYPVYTTR